MILYENRAQKTQMPWLFHHFVHIETAISAMFRAHFQRHPGPKNHFCCHFPSHIWISIEMTCDLTPTSHGGTKKMDGKCCLFHGKSQKITWMKTGGTPHDSGKLHIVSRVRIPERPGIPN